MIGLPKKGLICLSLQVRSTIVVDEDYEVMITLFHNSGALIYCDEDGNTIGTTDVFDRIEAAKKHFIKVGLGEEYVNQFIR